MLLIASTVSAAEATTILEITSVNAGGHDGDFPENTLDDDLGTS